jgi:hypothetical protein
MRPRLYSRTWTRFGRRDRSVIEAQLAQGAASLCPRCAAPLEARPITRLTAVLPGDIEGIDLDCRGCHQFHPRLSHTPHSRYLLRLRRLAAAVHRS